MADLSIFEKYPNSFRIDHPDFGDVSKTTYAKGVITAFYEDNGDDPVVAMDVCDLTIDDQEFKEVPIFYHPPKTYIDNWKLNAEPSVHPYGELISTSAAWAEFWKSGGALLDKDGKVIPSVSSTGLTFENNSVARGAYSFSVGDEVAVMLKDGEALAVIGFADGIPRRPLDYIKVEMPSQVFDSNDPSNVGDPHCPYILQLSDSARNVTPSGPNPGYSTPTGSGLGPDGFDLKLLKDAKVFPDKVAHPTPGAPSPLYFAYDYACFYGSNPASPGNIVFDGGLWNPNPDPAFGPFFGYMHFGTPPDSPWADYLAAWLNTCDTVQTTQGYGGPNQPWLGAWPNGLGRPAYWLWLVDDPSNPANQSKIDYVMRTYLIEAGPMLFIVRVFYRHMTPPSGGGKVWYWKNRIAWPINGFPPPSDWSGYPADDRTKWTPPMWVNGYGPNPWPTKIDDCIPPPDGFLSGTNHQETFYSDNPHYIYAAPSSKKILDDIDSIVAASNAKIDVTASLGGAYPAPPDGFRNIFGNGLSFALPPGFIPYVGNLRELNFKIAARIGAS